MSAVSTEAPGSPSPARSSRQTPTSQLESQAQKSIVLDVDDVDRSARKGASRILGKGERVRQVPIHPQLHAALNGWLARRADWLDATDFPPWFSTNAGSASASGAPTTPSPASPRPPASTTTRPATSSGTRSRPRSCAAAQTSSSSPSSSATPASKPPCLDPPAQKTAHARSPVPRRQIAAFRGPDGLFHLILAVPRLASLPWRTSRTPDR